jgi:anti-anti-sigma factor
MAIGGQEFKRHLSFLHALIVMATLVAHNCGLGKIRQQPMSDSLSLTVETLEGLPVLRLKGKLVYGQHFQPLYDIATRLGREGHQRIVIDLTNVESTDSSGMSALLEIRRIFGEQPGAIVLLRPSERLRAALAMIRVASMFDMITDEAELRRPG